MPEWIAGPPRSVGCMRGLGSHGVSIGQHYLRASEAVVILSPILIIDVTYLIVRQ